MSIAYQSLFFFVCVIGCLHDRGSLPIIADDMKFLLRGGEDGKDDFGG